MPLTRRMLASGDWRVAFRTVGFKVMTLRGLDDFAIIHEENHAGRVTIRYSVFKRKFTSPSEAIKFYNAEQQRITDQAVAIFRSGLDAAGITKPAAARTGVLSRRRNQRA